MGDERLKKVYDFAKDFMEKNTNNPYHNFKHAEQVADFVKVLADGENISDHDRFLLLTAAYMHDIIYVLGNKDNEEKSAEIAEGFLNKIDYIPQEIIIVKELILTTKIPTNPKNKLEMILCDADIENLGTDKFFDKEKSIMEEFNHEYGLEWNKIQLDFLKEIKYYTKTAKKLRNKGLKKNIELLKKRMDNF
ncbi:MAG: HD domain-containing protein [Nanoarchaeota archaeon]|nr:HD domain-containing protein [Nanoarchaeota archaeon]